MTLRDASSPGQEGVPARPSRGFANANRPGGALRVGVDIQEATPEAAAGKAPLHSLRNPPRLYNFPTTIFPALSKEQPNLKRSGSLFHDRSLSPAPGLWYVGVRAGAGLRWVPASRGLGRGGARLAGAQRCPKARSSFLASEPGVFMLPCD